jgi:hypothetical protein
VCDQSFPSAEDIGQAVHVRVEVIDSPQQRELAMAEGAQEFS